MLHSARAFVTLSLALSFSLPLLGGCENSERQNDAAVARKVEEVEKARLKAETDVELARVQDQYDTLAATQGLTPEMKALIRGRQAQLRMERTMLLLADLRARELSITRCINDLGQLGVQLAGSQMRIDALNKFDPSVQIQNLQAQQAQIKGSADQPTWKIAGGGVVDIPTVAKLDGEIDALNAAIQKNKSDAAALAKTSRDSMDQADDISRQAEAESGDKQVQDTIKGSQLRRDAGIADAQIDTLGAQLGHLQARLDAAKAQKAALDQAVASFDTQISALSTGWTKIQEQIEAQRKLEHGLIAGPQGAENTDPTATVNISSKLQDLATRLREANDLRENVNKELNSVIEQFGDAAAQAEKLRNDLMARSQQVPNDPDAAVWDQLKLTLHPAFYNLQKADAMEVRAAVAASKTGIDIAINQMMNGPGTGLVELLKSSRTGVEAPKALADVTTIGQEQLDQDKEAVNHDFQQTLTAYDKTYGGTDSRDDVATRNKIRFIGRSVANREWAQFAAVAGDTQGQEEHLHDAELDQSQVNPESSSAADSTAATARGLRSPAAAAPGDQ